MDSASYGNGPKVSTILGSVSNLNQISDFGGTLTLAPKINVRISQWNLFVLVNIK